MNANKIKTWISSIYSEERSVACLFLPILKLLLEKEGWVDRNVIEKGISENYGPLGRGNLSLDHLWAHRITKGNDQEYLNELIEYKQPVQKGKLTTFRIKAKNRQELQKILEKVGIQDEIIKQLVDKRIEEIQRNPTHTHGDINSLIRKFLIQVGTDDQTHRQYNVDYKKLKASASFGMGNLAAVPWIAFTGYDQKVSQGVYPVLLYYKTQGVLISAFGISENGNPEVKWKNSDDLTTITTHFEQASYDAPQKYGTSYVNRVFENPSDEIDNIVISLDEIIKNYHELFSNQTSINTLLSKPINTILYGPPGTGKTYSTRKKAVCIVDSDWCAENYTHEEVQLTDEQLEEIKQKYDEFVESGQIVFTTFHQSFSYEDFIQGISAELNDEGQLQYEVKAGIFKKLCNEADKNSDKKYVLIIDEINRGNISKIFGELITLLEKDKRKGEENELAVKLPYSNEDCLFSVPDNVYVIGTMNTADKSLANMDLALRRRFDFEEVPPNYSILNNKSVGGVELDKLLETINQRIEVLIDRDHLIGHSYLMGVENIDKLGEVFKKRIIPLLQEYFYDDWGRIRWVLNDHRKDDQYQFIRNNVDRSVSDLFGEDVNVSERRFHINQDAFGQIESYKGII